MQLQAVSYVDIERFTVRPVIYVIERFKELKTPTVLLSLCLFVHLTGSSFKNCCGGCWGLH